MHSAIANGGPPGLGGGGTRQKSSSSDTASSKGTRHHATSRHATTPDGMVSMVLFRPLGPGVSEKEFQERLEMMTTDLHRLLKMESQDFWSMISFDRSILKSIDSFLRFSPRHWFEFENLSEETKDILLGVNRLVFLILLRLATNKNTSRNSGSKKGRSEVFTTAEFGQLIYDQRIWTIPMLFDTVALFGRQNGDILSRMIDSMFTAQPKFADDLAMAFSATEAALKRLVCQFDDLALSIKSHDAANLLMQISDMVLFLFDTFSTLETFIKIFPSGGIILEESASSFLPYCAEFFETTLQSLLSHLSNMKDVQVPASSDYASSSPCHDVETLLLITVAVEVKMVCAFHTILNAISLSSPDHINPESYFGVLTTAVGYHRFLWLLDKIYPIANDIAMLERNKANAVDISVKDYVLSAVREVKQGQETTLARTEQAPMSPGGASGGPSRAELAGMVDSVCNVMGTGLDRKFIGRCLVRYEYNADALVQALLDDNLPPDLRDENQTATVPDEDDNYDYSSENIEAALTSVHLGKRETNLDGHELKDMKPFYNKFAKAVTTSSMSAVVQQPGPSNRHRPVVFASVSIPEIEYDDEYDDTYDDNEGAVGPQGSAGDEIIRRRGFTVPRILTGAGPKKVNAWEVEEDDESSEMEEDGEAAQSQRQDGGRGGWQRSGGRGGSGKQNQEAPVASERPPPRSGDTRGFKGANRDRKKIEAKAARDANSASGGGRPQQQQNLRQNNANTNFSRGDNENGPVEEQGETTENVSRQRKERCKGNVGNHNRRDLAAWKRREF